MAMQPRPNTGYLSQNTKKLKETQPDITGFLDVQNPDGSIRRMQLAGWAKENDRGKFYSLKISEDQKRAAPAASPASRVEEESEELIPF